VTRVLRNPRRVTGGEPETDGGSGVQINILVNRLTLLPLLAMILIAVMGCSAGQVNSISVAAGSGEPVIRISGAGGTSRTLQALANEYTRSNPGVAFEFLEGSGSSGGVKGVNAGFLDLGAMSRLPKQDEMATGIEYVNFAAERVSVVTSSDLPLPGLPVEQVRGIFSGEIRNWSEVGGPDVLIRIIIREEDDSNTKIMRAGIMGDTPFSETALLMTSESDAKEALNKAAGAIGYLAFSGVVSSGSSVNPVALDGVHPSGQGPGYPLPARDLGVAFLPAAQGRVQSFLDYITGAEAGAILADLGLLAAG